MSFLFGKSKSQPNNMEDKKPLFLEQQYVQIYEMAAGKLERLVQLPPRTDIQEWLATNSLAFFNQVNTQVGTISELCTATTCPNMSAGKEVFSKKSNKTIAKQYIDNALANVQKWLQNEDIFPTKFGFEFPSDFLPTVRKIFRYFLHILAHVYYHHFHEIVRLDLHEGLNTLFLHFVYFVQEFNLVEHKDMSCLDDLAAKLVQADKDIAKRPRTDQDDLSLDGISQSKSDGLPVS